MNNATTFVGLDVHARSVKVCAFVPSTGEITRKSFGYEPGEIASWVASLPQPAECVYESGVTGFHLCRELSSLGADCVADAVRRPLVGALVGRSAHQLVCLLVEHGVDGLLDGFPDQLAQFVFHGLLVE